MHDSLHHFKFPLYSEKSVSSNIRKLIGSAALATCVEENLRVKMVPHYGYTPSPRVQKARGPSVLSTLTIPFRKYACYLYFSVIVKKLKKSLLDQITQMFFRCILET
jgi:hypothetical protein